MNSKLQQQLEQGGQRVQQRAQARLDQWDVSTSVCQAIEADQVNTTRPNAMWYGLAAAVTLTAMLWTFNASDFVSVNQSALYQSALNQQVATKPIELKLNQLPLTLEQSINQPLLDEQHAIIEDLKTLKAQLLSI